MTSTEIREPAARIYGLLARQFEMPLFVQKVVDVLQECSYEVHLCVRIAPLVRESFMCCLG